jgi:hypothetical protein
MSCIDQEMNLSLLSHMAEAPGMGSREHTPILQPGKTSAGGPSSTCHPRVEINKGQNGS